MFIIAGGEAEVTKAGVKLGAMHPGDFFGEIAYIKEERQVRSATVTAATTMEVVEIHGDALHHASAGLQTIFSKALLKLLVARIENSDRKLIARG
jgi:CRP-like cAMP-binding protein